MLGAAVGAAADALEEHQEHQQHQLPSPPLDSIGVQPRRRRPRGRANTPSLHHGRGRRTEETPSQSPLVPGFRALDILTSLVAGWSAFPSFALLVTVCLNFTYLRFASFLALFIETEEGQQQQHGPSAAAVAFLTLRTLSLLFTARNALAMSWDFLVGAFVCVDDRRTDGGGGGGSRGQHAVVGWDNGWFVDQRTDPFDRYTDLLSCTIRHTRSAGAWCRLCPRYVSMHAHSAHDCIQPAFNRFKSQIYSTPSDRPMLNPLLFRNALEALRISGYE